MNPNPASSDCGHKEERTFLSLYVQDYQNAVTFRKEIHPPWALEKGKSISLKIGECSLWFKVGAPTWSSCEKINLVVLEPKTPKEGFEFNMIELLSESSEWITAPLQKVRP